MKKLIIGATVVALTAGVSMAANIEYAGSGNWTNYVYDTPGTGWNVASPQTINTNTARVSGSRVVTVTTTDATATGLQIGVASSGTAIVANGGALRIGGNVTVGNNATAGTVTGTLTIENGGTYTNSGWMQVGAGNWADLSGILNVNAGGVANLGNHLWVGSTALGDGTINVGGTLNVHANFALGGITTTTASGGIGVLNILDGGVFNKVNQGYTETLTSSTIHGSSSINIFGTGYAMFNGNTASQVAIDIASGKIYGDTVAGGVVTWYDSGLNKTIIAVPEPATIGMLGLGAMAVLGIRRIRRRA